MITRTYKALTSRPVFVLAAALAILMLAAPFVFAADTEVDYPENSTHAVATFSATDQDGDPIVWSLGGDDDGDFTIDGGVLNFKSPPDYESPVSASIGTRADMNVYNVTVQASGGKEEVVVTVTNVDEDGSVSFSKLGRFQPQVGRSLEANLTDQDGGVTDEAWQWARSMDMETWTDIDGATTANRGPAAADEGYYLRATVTYTDMFGSGKMESAVTGNAVEERTVSNAAPSFNDQDDDNNGDTAIDGIQVNRSMDENTDVSTNIGRPVSASDGDNDTLVYSLEETPDLKDGDDKARFTINAATGQIKVGKKLGADVGPPDQREDEGSVAEFPAADYAWLNDTSDGATAHTAATGNVYILLVKATDPSGASKTQPVAVKVNDVNEAPSFVGGDNVPKVLNVLENTTALRRAGATGATALTGTPYDANDEDADRSLGGTTTTADNETDAFLSLDGADAKYFAITNEGVLTIDADQDNDNTDDFMPDYEDKSSYSIAVVATSGAGDRTRRARLDVTVHVIDAEDPGKVSLTAREPQAERTVVATVSDSDGGVTLSRWTWATSESTVDAQGDVTAECRPDTATIIPAVSTWTTVTPDVSSGAYTPKAADANRCLRATATYTDNIEGDGNDNADDGNMEMVSLVSEKPVQISDPANAAPVFPDQDLTTLGDQSDTAMRSVVENEDDETVGGPISATDGDGDAMLFTLSGDDAASFKTDNMGQIKTKVKLDYETKDTYMVMLTATDPSGASDSIMVTVTVTDGPDNAVITGSTAVDYDENGTGPVASFSATDQDGDDIVWSLGGTDEGDFTIDDGVLSFKSSPNYEDPKSGSIGTRADRNVYNVTVKATGGEEMVVVTVVNVDEDGSVSFSELGQVQPQVGRSLEATVSDPDMGVTDEKWQWARSMDMQTWTDIDGGTSARRTPVAADEGYYLRASVTYTDTFGSDKTAYKMTPNAVEERTVANAKPSFADQDDVEDDANTPATLGVQADRTVDENTPAGTNIGKPVSASDADSDVLVYTLSGNVNIGDTATPATDLFGISPSTGQLRAKAALNFEGEDTGASATNPSDNLYSVTVTATDPSGATGTATVRITLRDVPEPADFSTVAKAQTTMTVTEVIGTADTDVADDLDGNADETGNQVTFAAADPDVVEGTAETVAYSLAGADAQYFTLGAANAELAVRGDDGTTDGVDERHRPNYEDKSSYSITIVAQSGTGDGTFRSRLDVTVNVLDAEDPGSVKLTAREPQVDRTVVATLSDPDGGVALTMWAWATQAATPGQDDDPPTCPLAGTGTWDTVDPAVSSGAYTPKMLDAGNCLRATATYTDNLGTDTTTAAAVTERPVQTSNPANAAPEFPDQDLTTEGDQSDEAMRSVVENKADQNVGGPIDATDTDALLYTLSGDDAASFKVDNAGQIKTKVKLDYETKDMYVVALTASDPSGATDSILVTIMVIDGPDPAVIDEVTEPDSECVTGGAVDSTASDGLVSDCEALLASEDALVGTGTGLNWDAGTPIADWDGIAVTDGRVTNVRLLSHGLAGMIPARLADLDGLVKLQLHDNDLGGDIPDLSALDNLEWLLLHRNAFTGGIPASLGGLDSIDFLYLYSNDGGLDGGIPSELGNLTSLRHLQLHDNGLTGEIPASLGNLSRLRYLLLSRNNLSGSIPSELGNATNLKALYLYMNMLTGPIPVELGNMVQAEGDTLRILYLHKNMLDGEIPMELGNLTSLTNLWLNGNMLTGGIPSELDSLSNLARWRLSGNMLTGCIPAALAGVENSDMAATGLPACQ